MHYDCVYAVSSDSLRVQYSLGVAASFIGAPRSVLHKSAKVSDISLAVPRLYCWLIPDVIGFMVILYDSRSLKLRMTH